MIQNRYRSEALYLYVRRVMQNVWQPNQNENLPECIRLHKKVYHAFGTRVLQQNKNYSKSSKCECIAQTRRQQKTKHNSM